MAQWRNMKRNHGKDIRTFCEAVKFDFLFFIC